MSPDVRQEIYMSWKKKPTYPKASNDRTPASIGEPHLSAQMFLPDSVYNTVMVDAFKRTPTITWRTPTKKAGEFLLYGLSVDAKAKGRDNASTLMQVHYYGVVDQNGKQIGEASKNTTTTTGTQVTTQPSLAGEIAKIQALGLDAVTTKTCIDAIITKYGQK